MNHKKIGIAILFWGLVAVAIAQQGTPISCEFNGTPLSKVLHQLNTEFGLDFAFDNETVKDIFIEEKIERLPAEQALQALLADTPLDFQLVSATQVLIFPKKEIIPVKEAFIDISGVVRDELSNTPLQYATVFSKTGNGTTTDANGKFNLRLNRQDSLVLLVQYIGYETKQLSIAAQSSASLDVKLSPQITAINAITVVEELPIVTSDRYSGALQIQASKLQQLPTFPGGTDVFRTLQMLPGVSAFDDASAEINIRGGSADENMVLLDGIMLRNVTHFYGIFSVIDANAVDEIALYKNAFPAEYGGRTSGIIELQTKSTDVKKWQSQIEINRLMSSAQLTLPINDKMGLFASGRMTTTNLGESDFFNYVTQNDNSPPILAEQRLVVNQIVPFFKFHDFMLKYVWQLEPSLQFRATYFQGKDMLQVGSEKVFQFREEAKRSLDQQFEETNTWLNRGGSMHLEKQWNDRASSVLSMSYSQYNFSGSIENATTQFSERDDEQERRVVKNDFQNGTEGGYINLKNTLQLKNQGQLHLGYNLVQNKSNINIDLDETFKIKQEVQALENVLYAQYQQQLNQQLHLDVGLRLTHYDLKKRWYASPRLQLQYNLQEKFYLKSSLSHYNQFLQEFYFEDRFGREYSTHALAGEATGSFNLRLNKDFSVLSSTNFMLGFNLLNNWLELDVEAYYKYMDGIQEIAPQFLGFDEETNEITQGIRYDLFDGDGYTVGLDILAKKRIGAYEAWVAYTLSKSENRFPAINRNQYFPSQNDRRHQLKWMNTYEWKRWNFSAAYVYTSGRPYLDLSSLVQKDRREIFFDERLNYLRDYHRIDLGVSYTFPLFAKQASLGFSIFNLTNRQNIKYIQYIYQLDETRGIKPSNSKKIVLGNELDLLDRTYNFSFKIEF